MRKLMFFAAVLCLFTMSAFAQKASFAGTWTLDKEKSKLDDRMRNNIESMTWMVAQTDTELKVTTATKRQAPPADAPARPGGGGMGRGGFGGGDGTTAYDLTGKETKVEVEGRGGKVPQTLKATASGGKLQLSKSVTMTTDMGEMTMTTKETWELGADGKTMTVTREQTNPRGTNTSTLVFVKS